MKRGFGLSCRAPLTGRPIEPLGQPHMTLWGTALMAARGAGVFDDLLTAAAERRPSGRMFTPMTDCREACDRVYADYLAFRAVGRQLTKQIEAPRK